MSKKLKLDDLRVNSFLTTNRVKGGECDTVFPCGPETCFPCIPNTDETSAGAIGCATNQLGCTGGWC